MSSCNSSDGPYLRKRHFPRDGAHLRPSKDTAWCLYSMITGVEPCSYPHLTLVQREIQIGQTAVKNILLVLFAFDIVGNKDTFNIPTVVLSQVGLSRLYDSVRKH